MVPVRSCLKLPVSEDVKVVEMEGAVGAASVKENKAVQTEGAPSKPRTLQRRLRRRAVKAQQIAVG